jgi:transposase
MISSCQSLLQARHALAMWGRRTAYEWTNGRDEEGRLFLPPYSPDLNPIENASAA